jgi:hypothetical protein
MSANRSVDRSAVAHENGRSSLCSFSFADGRRCRTPRCSAHPHLCYYHARKEAQALAAQQMGRGIASDLSGGYLSACDLSSALGRLFSAAAQGQVEYINAFGTDSWRRTILSSFASPSPDPHPTAEPDLLPCATASSK